MNTARYCVLLSCNNCWLADRRQFLGAAAGRADRVRRRDRGRLAEACLRHALQRDPRRRVPRVHAEPGLRPGRHQVQQRSVLRHFFAFSFRLGPVSDVSDWLRRLFRTTRTWWRGGWASCRCHWAFWPSASWPRPSTCRARRRWCCWRWPTWRW